jgi:hypothetical protein
MNGIGKAISRRDVLKMLGVGAAGTALGTYGAPWSLALYQLNMG